MLSVHSILLWFRVLTGNENPRSAVSIRIMEYAYVSAFESKFVKQILCLKIRAVLAGYKFGCFICLFAFTQDVVILRA
jgi:hypothetical protein